MNSRKSLARDCTGASAVEFALVVPFFLMLLMGGFYAAMAAFAASDLQHAVEAGARCASVSKTICSSTTTTRTYAAGKYAGVGPTPTFAASTAACGNQVTATLNFPLDAVFVTFNVPLTAQACYP